MNKDLVTYEERTGMRIIAVVPKDTSVVRLRISASLGIVHAENAVLTAFLADMLLRGTTKSSKDHIEEQLETLGVALEISAQDHHIHIEFTTRALNLTAALLVLSEVMVYPAFSATEITKLKKECHEALREEKNNSRFLAAALFSRTLYDRNEYAYVPTAHERAKLLDSIDGAFLRKAHKALRSVSWNIGVAASSSDRKRVLESLAAMQLKLQEEIPLATPIPQTRKMQTLYEYVPSKQNIEYFIGNRIPMTTKDEAYVPLAFGIDVLGKRGGFAGRLMSTVREKEGLTYSIYAWLKNSTSTTCGHFSIWTFFTPKDSVQGLASTLRELRSIVQKGITPDELTRFKELTANQFKLAHESTSGMLALYHTALEAGSTPQDIENRMQRVGQLTQAEVREALMQYCNPDTLVICGAGSTKELLEK